MTLIKTEKVNECRRKLKELGYNLRTSQYTEGKRFAKVVKPDEDGETFVYGTGANVYTAGTFEEHGEAIDVFKKYTINNTKRGGET